MPSAGGPAASRAAAGAACEAARRRWRRRLDANDDSAGAFSMPAGSASFDSVVTIRPRSVKNLRAVAVRSARVSESSDR